MGMRFALRQIKRAVMWMFFHDWISHGTVERIFRALPLKHA